MNQSLNHMDNTYNLNPGNEMLIPLTQKRNNKIIAIKIKYSKTNKGILHVIPIYEKDPKIYRYPLTEFHLN